MTWLDSAIGWFFPKAGLERARARAALGMVRSYEGASSTRRTANWRTSGASANSEITGGLAKLRARSRDLVRNNPYGRRAIAALVGNAIGTGITLGCDNAQVNKVWGQWVSEADFYGDHDLYGLQALAARSTFESGDCMLVRVRTSTDAAGISGVPLRIKVLEGDFLDTNVHGPQTNGNTAVMGIELDAEGRRVAFHLFLAHPGEISVSYKAATKSVRVPAEDVIYLFEKERPGQVLGVPRLAASIMKLRDLDEYQEALLVKKKIEACFAAFVSTDDDSMKVGTSSSTETDSDGTSRRVEKLNPGQIIYGKLGESITFGQPSSSSDEGFTRDQLHAIAAGAGCTYEQLTGDLSQVNYSSMRGGRAEFKLMIEQFRWLTFVPQACERIYGWFEEAAFNSGKLRKKGYEHTWTPPRWEYVNPLEDVKADKEELAAGLASLSEKLRERGMTPEAVFKEIADERQKLEDLGVEVEYSAGTKTAASDSGDTKPDGAEDGQDAANAGTQQLALFVDAIREQSASTAGAIAVLASAVRETPINVDARSTTTIEPGAIQVSAPVDARTSIADGAVRLEAPITVQPAELNVRAYPSETEETIERDQRGEMTRVVRKAKD